MSNEPVAWIDNSGHPHHLRYVQSATEKHLYGPLRPLYEHAASDDTALLRQALEALEVLETYMPYYLRDRKRPLITALRERLEGKV